MAGFESLVNLTVCISVDHDDENDVMLQMRSGKGCITTYLQPQTLDSLIEMLQRMQLRQQAGRA